MSCFGPEVLEILRFFDIFHGEYMYIVHPYRSPHTKFLQFWVADAVLGTLNLRHRLPHIGGHGWSWNLAGRCPLPVLFIVRALPCPAVVAWENRPWSWLRFKGPPARTMLDCIQAKYVPLSRCHHDWHCFHRIHFNPERIIMIGDRLDTDILFGQGSGLEVPVKILEWLTYGYHRRRRDKDRTPHPSSPIRE